MRVRSVLCVLLIAVAGDAPAFGSHDRQFWSAVWGATTLRIGEDCRASGVDVDSPVDARGPEAVREFLQLFRFDETASWRACACHSVHAYATVRLDFGGARRLELELSRDLAVGGVPWDTSVWGEPEDRQAQLTIDSARDIQRWLSSHGKKWIADRLEDDIASVADSRTCASRAAELLPADVRAELEAVVGDCDAGKNEAAVLRRHVPDADARATLSLRLVANLSAGYSGALETLDRMPRDELRAVLRRARADPETSFGADRWILRHDRAPPLDRATLDEFLRPAAERLLADSRYRAHDWALWGLRDADHPDATALLRTLLDSTDPEDRYWATEILVFSKEDVASFSRIRELAREFDEHRRELLVERMSSIEEHRQK